MKSYHNHRNNRKKNNFQYTKQLIEPIQFPFKKFIFLIVIIMVLIMIQIYNRVILFHDSIDCSKLKKQCQLISKQNAVLKTNIQYLSSNQRIDKIAQQKLNMVYPRESNIVIFTNEKKISNELLAKL